MLIVAIAEAFLLWLFYHFRRFRNYTIWKIFVVSILLIYITGVFLITIGTRKIDYSAEINVIPFNAIYKLIRQIVISAQNWGVKNIPHELTFMQVPLRNFFGNILLLIPLGYLLPLWIKKINMWKISFIGISLSLIIEIIQLVTQTGYFDIDDVLLNASGCLIGWLFYRHWFAKRVV